MKKQKQDVKKMADVLIENQKEILDNWIQKIMEQTGTRTVELMSEDQLYKITGKLLQAMIAAIKNGYHEDSGQTEYSELDSLLNEISTKRAEMGFTSSETAAYIFSFKDIISPFLQKIYGDFPDILYSESGKLNKLIDRMGLITFEAYSKARDIIIQQQSHSLRELSTPVIKAWDSIILLPLVGIIDTARAQEMIEKLLQGVVDNEARVAVIDISGVPIIDTRVAQHLIKTVTAATMLGAEVILTGISPEIAQTIIKLDIDLSKINTRGSLKSGIEDAFNFIGLKIIPKN